MISIANICCLIHLWNLSCINNETMFILTALNDACTLFRWNENTSASISCLMMILLSLPKEAIEWDPKISAVNRSLSNWSDKPSKIPTQQPTRYRAFTEKLLPSVSTAWLQILFKCSRNKSQVFFSRKTMNTDASWPYWLLWLGKKTKLRQ